MNQKSGKEQMSKETREHISSLMDGEISREASRFLVRRLGSDEELCATWARYHVARDCLRNPDGGLAREDLCARVNRALEEEQVPTQSRKGLAWLRPVAGAAIAASVALVAVLAVNPGGKPGVAPTATIADTTAVESFSSPQGLPGATVATQAVSTQRMNSYLLRHYQAAGNGRGAVGLMPVMVIARPVTAAQQPETVTPDTPNESEADRQQ